MSSSPSSRGSSRGTPQRPSTPDQTRPTVTRASSFSVAPKSEYLRNALQARRAQHTPTPSPLETRLPPSTATKPPDLRTPNTSPDVFAEFALSEEQTTPVSPIRRRRPSDAGPPRSKTNRELTNEIEKLKDSLMTSNMRVELLKNENSKLQHSLTDAKERIEQLEPLEEENYDLHTENNQLRLKVEDMDEQISSLKDINDEHRKTNEELTAIASESAAHWQAHEFAIEEAAECIIEMEEEKASLSNELKQLKERVAALEDTSSAHALVDGSPRYPVRVYSVDESRPSTSHFDSDYYSQPDSPVVKASGDSIISLTPSERSKKFLDLTEERRRSARDLVKRISVASLKALSIRSPSPQPEVPRIPVTFQQQIPQTIPEEGPKTTPKTPGRYRKTRQVVSQSPFEDSHVSPVRPSSVAPQAPTPQSEGLRGLYRPERSSRNKTSYDVRPSSSHVVSPTNTVSSGQRQRSVAEVSPRVPSRGSSKQAHTSSSSEHLPRHTPNHRRQSESDMRSASNTPESTPASVSSEWASMAPPPPVSVVSQSDLMTVVDPREDKERWWRSMDRLTLSQVAAQAQRSGYGAPHLEVARPINGGRTQRLDGINTSLESLKNGGRQSRTAPSTTLNTPYAEPENFLFNPAESEEDFLRKARIGPRR